MVPLTVELVCLKRTREMRRLALEKLIEAVCVVD